MKTILAAFLLLVPLAQAQISQFPYIENFDSVIPPALPSEWTSTQNRTPEINDFTTSSASARSNPNAVLSTNARISQSLISPVLDFSGRNVDSIFFFERRSNTDTTGILVEASTDGGITFDAAISDTLQLINPSNYVRRAFALPSILSGINNVKIRWRVLGDLRGGTTGTLRFDDILITTVLQFDAGVTAVTFSPLFPRAGDSVIIAATVKNFGRSVVQKFTVKFYDDINLDSIPQSGELFDSVEISTLSSGDSISISSTMSNLALGERQFIVQTTLANDENPSNDWRVTRMTVGLRQFSVVLNEIMYAPTSGEPEWVEIFHTLHDTINLKNWKISNRNTSSKYSVTATDVFLVPQQFAVVTKDTALLFAVHPPISSPVLQVSSMPTFLFNNNGDAAVLFDSRGALMDSVHYAPAWGGSAGRSLERIEAGGPSGDSTNWGSSADSSTGTPGRHNSLTPVQFDLRASRIFAFRRESSLDVNVLVANVGRDPAVNFFSSLYYDADGDSVPQSSELLERRTLGTVLQPRDSLIVTFVWNNPGYGQKAFIAQVEYPEDLRPSNNTVLGVVRVSYPQKAVVINEIMYAPLTGQAEYVELYNRSSAAVDVRDWKISDMRGAGTGNEYVPLRRAYALGPGGYALVASDSSIIQQYNLSGDSTNGIHLFIMNTGSLSLNNEGDDVILSDLTGYTIDSLRYTSNWQNPELSDVSGRALERINPELPSTDRRNWSTSAAALGGTPGRQNSIFTASVPSSASLVFAPNPFSPDGDGFEDFTLISYEVPTAAALLRIRIYDAKGRLVRTLANSEPTGARGNLIWDGMNDNRERVRMGIYIVLIEALDATSATIHSTKGIVVVAAKM